MDETLHYVIGLGPAAAVVVFVAIALIQKILAAVRRTIREHGGDPSIRQVGKLLDERLAHRGRAGEDAAIDR